MKELNPNNYPVTPEIAQNLEALLRALNVVRKAWGQPMTVTSGLRSREHQIEVYRLKGITDLSKIPLQSAHLTGQAADILDLNGSLGEWLKNNIEVLIECELYVEHLDFTRGWAHLQTRPPASHNRFFIP